MNPSTSLQRTYRNLRIAIAGTVVLIAVAVWVAGRSIGVLSSISAYFYTDSRGLFVAALVAAGVSILALSGYGVQRALLDAAGLIAPLIAILPTPISNSTVPGLTDACPDANRCVPASAVPAIDAGVTTYVIVAVLGILAAALVTALRSRTEQVDARSVVPSFVVAVVVVALVAGLWWGAPAFLLAAGHVAAAAAFFALIAAVAVANVFSRPRPTDRMPGRTLKITYLVIAAAMVVDLIVLLVLIAIGVPEGTMPPPVFVGEFILLGLFFVFWVLQTVQNWNSPDPKLASDARP